MIDYKIISESIEFYKDKGYVQIEVPWTVSEAIDDLTKPEDRIHMQLKHNGKCLVASGEQGFLYLYCKDYLPLGRYQTVTPCFRYEAYDGMHMKNFIKNELIITDKVDEENLDKIIKDAKEFFDKFVGCKIEKTNIGYDIVSDNGYELGSYGIRQCSYLKWIYGTGVAEPRLSRVIKSLK